MKILYIVLGDLGSVASGSGLRPNCMYRAFLERGHTVYVLSGNESRGRGKYRAADVKKAQAWVEENHPDFCYIESSTYPMIHNCDYGMIRYLHRKRIPTAYFYRDFYRVFPDLFPGRTGMVNRLKDAYLNFMQHRTDRILQKLDLVYFPSEESLPYFHYKRMKALPPAGEAAFLPVHPITKTCIYVGGISERYGLRLLLAAFDILNAGKNDCRLILVCRENEYRNAPMPDPLPPWLEVHHASGKELESLYERADLGLIALQPNAYADVAICIKLFQYLSYGLPVLSTDVAAMSGIIRSNGFGEVAAYDPQAYADAIRDMLEDSDRLRAYRAEIERHMTDSNLWAHRVDQIVQDLTEK